MQFSCLTKSTTPLQWQTLSADKMTSEKYIEHLKNNKILYMFLINMGLFFFFSLISDWYFFSIFFFLFVLNFIYCIFILRKIRDNYKVAIFVFYLSNFIISLILLNHLISSINPNHQFRKENIVSEYYFTKHISPTPKHNHLQVFRDDGTFIYLDCSSMANGHCPYINWDSKIKVEYILLDNPYFINKYLFNSKKRRFIYGLYLDGNVYDGIYDNQFFIERYSYEHSIRKKIVFFMAFYVIILFYLIIVRFLLSKNILYKNIFRIFSNVFFLILIHFYHY